MDSFFELCAIILTLPILWTLFLAGYIVCIPLFLLRWAFGKLTLILHPSWAGMLSDKDILFAEDPACPNPKPHSILLGYTTIEGNPTLAEIQERYLNDVILSKNSQTGKLNYPKFQQYYEYWFGYSFWKWEESFSIEKHIRLMEGTEDGKVVTEETLLSLLSPLANKPFKPKLSPWEYLYVPKYLPKDSTTPIGVLIKRIHHGIGDGYSILKSVVSYACGDTLDKLIPLARKSPSMTFAGKHNHQIAKYIMLTSNFVSTVNSLLTMPYYFIKHMATIDINAWFLPRSQLSRKCHLGITRKIPLHLVKQISRERGVSFSAILFSVAGGGVGRLFRKKYPDGVVKVPDVMQCFTPFPRPGHPNNKMVNHFTTALIKIFPGITSPVERLLKSEADLNNMKKSSFPISSHIMMSILAAFPVWYVRLIGANWFATTIVSNFPGPREYISYFRKYKISDMVFWTPHLNGSAGIGIGMLTYGESLRFALNVDSAILPTQKDVDDLCAYIEDELHSLLPPTNKSDENQNKISEKKKSIESRSSVSELRLRSVS